MANTNAEKVIVQMEEARHCPFFSGDRHALIAIVEAALSTAESNLAREVLAVVGQLNAPPHDHNMVAIRLRDLFTRLNVKID